MMWHISIGTGEYLTDKTVPHNRPNITFFEKTNKIVYLIDVSLSNLGSLQTAYTEKMRKYAELSTEVKQWWQVEAVSPCLSLYLQQESLLTHRMLSSSD